MSREEAAAHVGISRKLAAFHLDRLVEAGLLVARPGPFGEALDTFTSRAFAVCDHQVAHVYVARPVDRGTLRHLLVGSVECPIELLCVEVESDFFADQRVMIPDRLC